MLISTEGYRYNKNGELIKKDVSLLKLSGYKVKVKCDDCGKILEILWNNRLHKSSNIDFCGSCSHKGFKNSQFNKDRKILCKNARKYQIKNPMKGKHHSDESKYKMSIIKSKHICDGTFNILSNNRGRKSRYYSIKNNCKFHSDSNLELLRMIQLDNDKDVLSWTKLHKIKIPYTYNGKLKNTIPDFLIKMKNGINIIEEVKGYITEKEIIKKISIENYCINNNYQFCFKTQKEMNKDGEYRKFLKDLKNNKDT